MRLPSLLAALALTGLLPTQAAAPSIWNDVPADIAENGAIRWGSLPNGLRYAVEPNGTPKDHASLRLLVRVGSLWERDDELGMAHFVEHMAFRGTTRYPQGKLLPNLERMGMALGPDTAAFTGYDFTVYQLELPDTSEETLRLGLDVLHEFASEISFDPLLIKLERGVILSELRVRDTPQSRAADVNSKYLWPGSRFTARKPIGVPEQFFGFSRADLRAFYDAWYRPERMAVIVVGDLPADRAAEAITTAFAGLKARAPARPEPAELFPQRASSHSVEVLHQPGWTGGTIFLEHPVRLRTSGLTHADRVREMLWTFSYGIFSRRLQLLARHPNPPFSLPSTGNTFTINGWITANANVAVRLPGLERALPALEQEHRKALVYGFSPDELARQKAEMRASLAQAVAIWPTRSSPQRAAEIAQHLLVGFPLFEPAVFRRDMAGELEHATAADCLAAFRALWTTSAPHVLVIVPPEAPAGRYSIANLLNLSRSTPVSLPKQMVAAKLAYDHFGPAARLIRDNFDPGTDVHLAGLSNGVRLNFKHTDFEAHDVDFCVRVGEGWATDPGKPAVRWLASNGVTRGGLGRHTAQELTDLLAGHDVAVEFTSRPDAGIFYGRCAPEELPLALRVVAAYIVDAAFRPDEFEEVKSTLDAYFGDLDRSALGPIDLRGPAQIVGNDPRFQLPNPDQLHAVNAPDLARWLTPQLRQGAVELTIVGDVGWADAAAAAETTLGAINPRPAPRPFPHGTPVKLVRGSHRWQYTTDVTVSDFGIGIFWSAPSLATTHEERRCHSLAAVFNELVFTRLRSELGATYSPSVDFVRYESPPGCSYFEAKVSVDPRHVTDAIRIMDKSAAELAKRNVDPDVFQRALRPLVRSLADQRRSNAYWLYTVLDSAQNQDHALADAENRLADYNSITPAEIRAEAAKYLRPSNEYVFLTHPDRKRR